jgi:hypothetical protein
MRFTLNQKGESEIFQQFKILWEPIKIDLLGAGGVFHHPPRSQNGNVVILSMDTLKSLKILIEYLDKFPLNSNKNIAFSK